jgi:protease I
MAHVAVVLGEDFEDSELRVPSDRLKAAGHKLTILGKKAGESVKGKRGEETAKIDATASEHKASEYDALLIPGGFSPDRLRMDEGVVNLVRDFGAQKKPIAAVCHGPQLLIEADLVRGKTVTSWPSVKTDLVNAGAEWVDREVATDGNLITSRKPEDLEAFSSALLEAIERSSKLSATETVKVGA